VSTPTPNLAVKALDNQLNEQILRGDALEAFERFYADDVVMQENLEPPRAGKDVNRKIEQEFFSSVEQFHGAQLLGSAVNGDISYSEWEWDVTFKGGKRVKMTQVAARRWKNGKVIHERFYYHKA
jgi:ketosteroid isomerase-like protein